MWIMFVCKDDGQFCSHLIWKRLSPLHFIHIHCALMPHRSSSFNFNFFIFYCCHCFKHCSSSVNTSLFPGLFSRPSHKQIQNMNGLTKSLLQERFTFETFDFRNISQLPVMCGCDRKVKGRWVQLDLSSLPPAVNKHCILVTIWQYCDILTGSRLNSAALMEPKSGWWAPPGWQEISCTSSWQQLELRLSSAWRNIDSSSVTPQSTTIGLGLCVSWMTTNANSSKPALPKKLF